MITEVPALTPVTAPVEASMVATAGVAELQAPPVTEELSVEDPFAQIAVVPEMVPAEILVTVTVLVAVASAQLPPPDTVYVIVAVPAPIPVTKPEASTVAIVEELVDQVPPVSLEVKVVVEPTQISWFPETVPAFGAPGAALTVTVLPVVTQELSEVDRT